MKVFIRESNCTDVSEAIRKFQNHLLDNPSLQVKKGIGISGVESTSKRGGRRGSKRSRKRTMYTPVQGTDAQVRAALMNTYFRGPTAKGFVPSNIYKQMSDQEREVIWKIRRELDAAKKGDAATANTTISSLSQDTVAQLQEDVRQLMAVNKKDARRMNEDSDENSLFGSEEDEKSKSSKRSKSNNGDRQRPPGSHGRQR